jgi:hypothetical protein
VNKDRKSEEGVVMSTWSQWLDTAAATVSSGVKTAVDTAAVAVQAATTKIEEATKPTTAGAAVTGADKATDASGSDDARAAAPVDKEEVTGEKGILQATSERWASLVEKVWTPPSNANSINEELHDPGARPPPPEHAPPQPVEADRGVLLSLFGSVAKTIEATLKQPDAQPSSPPPPLLPPWHVDGPLADKMPVLKAQILNLSQEKWNFLEAPSEDILHGFSFSMGDMSAQAVECLKLDPQLEKMRWLLVPWKVKEEVGEEETCDLDSRTYILFAGVLAQLLCTCVCGATSHSVFAVGKGADCARELARSGGQTQHGRFGNFAQRLQDGRRG